MPRRDDADSPARGVVLRGAVFALAIALGAVAVWLIVTSTTQKRVELGVLAGLWGGLLGAFAIFGSRRAPAPQHVEVPVATEPAGFRDAVDRAEALTAEIQLRSSASLERAADAEQRRAFEAGLQTMLQREIGHIRDSVTGEVASLRSEVAGLRAELVEKVGGQLRLERIETTRVIGSDLEALQHEVRALKFASRPEDESRIAEVPERRAAAEPSRVVEPARVRPVSRESAQAQADVQPAVSPQPALTPQPAPPRLTPEPERMPETQSAPVAPPAPVAPVASPTPPPAPIPSPIAAAPNPTAPNPTAPASPPAEADGGDPFAAMPRITPFTAFELDPVESESAYNGRRRREEEARRARHAAESAAAAAAPAGGRRRAAEPDEAPIGAGRHGGPSVVDDGARHGSAGRPDENGYAEGSGRHGSARHDVARHEGDGARHGSDAGRHGAGRHSGAAGDGGAPAAPDDAADNEYDDTHDGVGLLNRLLSRDGGR